MATPARQLSGLPMDYFLRTGPVDPAKRAQLIDRFDRNRDFYLQHRDELFEEHRGKYVAVYGDRQLMIGDNFLEMCREIGDDDLAAAFTERLEDPMQFPSVWL